MDQSIGFLNRGLGVRVPPGEPTMAISSARPRALPRQGRGRWFESSIANRKLDLGGVAQPGQSVCFASRGSSVRIRPPPQCPSVLGTRAGLGRCWVEVPGPAGNNPAGSSTTRTSKPISRGCSSDGESVCVAHRRPWVRDPPSPRTRKGQHHECSGSADANARPETRWCDRVSESRRRVAPTLNGGRLRVGVQ